MTLQRLYFNLYKNEERVLIGIITGSFSVHFSLGLFVIQKFLFHLFSSATNPYKLFSVYYRFYTLIDGFPLFAQKNQAGVFGQAHLLVVCGQCQLLFRF